MPSPAAPRPELTVSVLIPSLNAARWIARAVATALAEDAVGLEVVVQDGGSTDGTLTVIDRVEDPRLRVESRPDRGQSDALNRAIERARGEWIVWLNADDELIPGALGAALGSAPPGCDVLVGDFETIAADGRVRRAHRGAALDRRRLLNRGCYAFSGATLIRRRVFAAHGGLDRRLNLAMDYELFLRIAPRVASRHVPLPVGRYRSHPLSKSSTQRWQMFREVGRIRRAYAATVAAPSLWWLGQARLGLYYASRSARRR